MQIRPAGGMPFDRVWRRPEMTDIIRRRFAGFGPQTRFPPLFLRTV
jgi:hypothetical protein